MMGDGILIITGGTIGMVIVILDYFSLGGIGFSELDIISKNILYNMFQLGLKKLRIMKK